MSFCKYQTDDGTKTYHLGMGNHKVEKRNGLYRVCGLSSGALSIGGVPVALEEGDSLTLAAKELRHCPNKYKLGQLELSV